VAVFRKNAEILLILKGSKLHFLDSVLDDFFFKIADFTERNSNIQFASENVSHKMS
jgi:hypothetical protein